MKAVLSFFLLFSFVFLAKAYCQLPQKEAREPGIKIDVNEDGKEDISYYDNGRHITEAQADTNYDGKVDVIVYTENGKFKAAEADSDYDGNFDKKFEDQKEFHKWLNEKNPDFEEHLNRPDWDVTLFKF